MFLPSTYQVHAYSLGPLKRSPKPLCRYRQTYSSIHLHSDCPPWLILNLPIASCFHKFRVECILKMSQGADANCQQVQSVRKLIWSHIEAQRRLKTIALRQAQRLRDRVYLAQWFPNSSPFRKDVICPIQYLRAMQDHFHNKYITSQTPRAEIPTLITGNPVSSPDYLVLFPRSASGQTPDSEQARSHTAIADGAA